MAKKFIILNIPLFTGTHGVVGYIVTFCGGWIVISDSIAATDTIEFKCHNAILLFFLHTIIFITTN